MADVVQKIEGSDLSTTQRRDMISAIKRICQIAGHAPSSLLADIPAVRAMLHEIRPAAHGISPKTFSNLRCLLAAALQRVGLADKNHRGVASRDAVWAPVMKAIAYDKRLSNGLAAFANWCAANGIAPEDVNDHVLQRFQDWLEARTLHPKPRDLVRRVPNVWNDAREGIEAWPQIELTRISFKAPCRHLSWDQLNDGLRRDAEAYLAMRAELDLFDERPNAPKRSLARATVRLQRDHLRLAVSVLAQNGMPVDDITSLADLIQPKAFKTILRHYYNQANGEPNAFVNCLAQTLIQVARHHVGAPEEQIRELKAIASKLPDIPFDMTEKNKALVRQFDSQETLAKLLFLPQQLLSEVARDLEQGRFRFVDAQVAIVVDVSIIAPLRPQNLAALNWARHFHEPDGPKGPLRLLIPEAETKTKNRDLIFEIPPDVAQRLGWYRRHVLPRLGADINGDLFVTERGTLKSQKTLAQQIISRIGDHVGIHMTPHQFRHVVAKLYLDEHPEDFETIRALLGHSFAKTTLIYAGSSSQRASKAHSSFVLEQRERLKLKRKGKRQRRGGPYG